MGGCGSTATSVADIQTVNQKVEPELLNVAVEAAVVIEEEKGHTKILNERCPKIRLDASDEVRTVPISDGSYGGVGEYIYVSQRGYYPDAMDKANQDSYLICENILGDTDCHAFGVFDGHGECGDLCSHFAADQFPKYLEEELKKYGGTKALADPTSLKQVYSKAMTRTNKAMHKSREVDDVLSGTTAVTVIIKDGVLYVGNVGDSRAIIATRNESGQTKYAPLSEDQTPYRKDERERLKKHGAVIMTWEQIMGEEELHEDWGLNLGEEVDDGGNPPRVWDQTCERPGCAFTRSMGDQIAEAVGVNAEPEVLTWPITPNDRYVVIASDGVFEFITSQDVINLIDKAPTLLDGAKKVVSESYTLWLTYDARTDDITIIVIDLQKLQQQKGATPRAQQPVPSLTDGISVSNKPVRRGMSKKMRAMISEQGNNRESLTKLKFDFKENTTPKTESQKETLQAIMDTNFLFKMLTSEHHSSLIDVMVYKEVVEGETIIVEKDTTDDCFIIDRGEFSVLKEDVDDEGKGTGHHKEIFQYKNAGDMFGEQSLMYGKPRGATIKATTSGGLWCIGRLAYRAVMQLKKEQSEALLPFLTAIPCLSRQDMRKLIRVANTSMSERFRVDSKVTHRSEWLMYVIQKGKVKVTDSEGNITARGAGQFLCSLDVKEEHVAVEATSGAFIAVSDLNRILPMITPEVIRSSAARTQTSTNKRRRDSLPFSENNLLASVKLMKNSSTDNAQATNIAAPLAVHGSFGFSTNAKFRNRPVGIKVISINCMDEAGLRENFELEKKLLISLSTKVDADPFHDDGPIDGVSPCPWVVRVMSHYDLNDIAYAILKEPIVCDLATAFSHAGDSLSLDAKTYYVASCISAICALHERGIIHRYVNPSSFVVTSDGCVRLIDLRFARRMEGARVFTVCGDATYFAPEVVSMSGYDYAVDLWSLGMLVYELFEDKHPIGDANTQESAVFEAITSFDVSSLSYSNKSTPEAAKNLVSHLLRNSPSDRLGYRDAQDLFRHAFFIEAEFKGKCMPNAGHVLSVEIVLPDETLEILEFDLD